MGERTAAERKRRGEFGVDLGEFPTVINFPGQEYALCLPVGRGQRLGIKGNFSKQLNIIILCCH